METARGGTVVLPSFPLPTVSSGEGVYGGWWAGAELCTSHSGLPPPPERRLLEHQAVTLHPHRTPMVRLAADGESRASTPVLSPVWIWRGQDHMKAKRTASDVLIDLARSARARPMDLNRIPEYQLWLWREGYFAWAFCPEALVYEEQNGGICRQPWFHAEHFGTRLP
jgi:hypothetical protein